uniref:Calmodulin-like protein 5 n=1 Tax=Rhizophora mucronata TaxID=61149 RepID=A0A2P2NKW8_RHIMU
MPVLHPGFPKKAAVKLTREQVKQTFHECDKDRNGVLDWNEMKSAFYRLGAILPSFRAWRGLHHADADGDGQIDAKELDDLVNYAYSLGYTIE